MPAQGDHDVHSVATTQSARSCVEVDGNPDSVSELEAERDADAVAVCDAVADTAGDTDVGALWDCVEEGDGEMEPLGAGGDGVIVTVLAAELDGDTLPGSDAIAAEDDDDAVTG